MNKKNSINPPINPGISLLVVVFLVLCLFTFSAITLTTSINEYNRTKNSAKNTKDYYIAVNKAEHDLNEIINDIKSSEEDFTIKEKKELTYDIDDYEQLQITIIPLTQPLEGEYFTVEKWQVVSTSEWNAKETIKLFNP